MANRKDYYFRQPVTEGELDAGFAGMEAADNAIMADQSLIGVFDEGVVSETGTPSLSVDISGPCLVYDQLGRRIFFSPLQNLDMSVDEFGNPTTVAGGGNAKILSIFIQFDRLLSDPRIDGNSATVYFERSESFKLNVTQGAEATSGSEVAPPLRSEEILLADVTIINGQTAIVNADIDMTTRRQDTFVLTGSPNSEREGQVQGILQAFQDQINAFILGGAASLQYAGGAAWADGTTNPATTIEGQLDKVITDLSVGAGAAKIITAAGPNWKDAVTNPAERLDERLDSIVNDISADAGAAKMGITAGTSGMLTAGESVQQALEAVETNLNVTKAHVLMTEAARSIQLNSIGGAAAWTYGEIANDTPGWSGPANSQCLIMPVQATGRLKGFRVVGTNGGGTTTVELIAISQTGTTEILASDSGSLTSLGLTDTCDVATNGFTRRYYLRIYTDGTAGTREINQAIVSMASPTF